MHRQRLTAYKGLVATDDMADALRALEKKASDNGKWRLVLGKPETRPHALSLASAGREVILTFEKAGATPEDALAAAWGTAIPLGFTPKLRYPLVEPGYDVFHFMGPWQGIYNRLIAEGRGHLGWPSVCCAAQVDVGKWTGDKEEARFVQAQLHRMGRNIGPIDGVIGQRTAAAIESLNLPRGSLTLVADHLRTAEPTKKQAATERGHLLIPGREVVVRGSDGVRAWPLPHGAGFEVSGPGTIVADVR